MEAKTKRRMYLKLLPVEEARALWFDRLDDLTALIDKYEELP